MAIFASLLVISSFVLANKAIDGYVLLITFIVALGTMNTMLTNDYFDRNHDKLKGKTFASENEDTFVFVTVILWLVTAMVSFMILYHSIFQGLILILCCILGILYSFTRHFSMLSAFFVALASALISQFPTEKSFLQDKIPVVLFSCTFFFVLAREIVKDVEDKDIDKIKNNKGNVYKKTLPVIMNKNTALIIAGCILSSGFICSMFLIPFTGKFYVIWVPVFIFSIISFIFYPSKYAIGAKLLDQGILVILFAILFPKISHSLDFITLFFNESLHWLDRVVYVFNQSIHF